MGRIIKKIINGLLYFLFMFIKTESKKAKICTLVSKLLFDRDNSLEYDTEFKEYWLKHKTQYLFIVKIPRYNFSKENLYKSIKNIYCKNYSPKSDDVIIDVGSGIGTETLFFEESIGKNGKIYSIEASTESYTKLKAFCIKNKIENAFNFNIAISNFNGKIWLEETEHFEKNRINNEQKGIEINCITLDQFVLDNNISKIDLLKINIEGAELEMIDGMYNAIKITNNIAVSCHDFLFKDMRNIKGKMINFLNANGFALFFNESGDEILDSWIYGKRK